MTRFPKKLQDKLVRRKTQNTLRHLPETNDLVDFSSNDYLGFSRNKDVFQHASQLVSEKGVSRNGATGSRLLSGNHQLYAELEKKLAEFHQTESALVFNSGYDANIGFFGAVPQRGDIVLYDELIHASIRDGIHMGNAKSYKFKHNDIDDLKRKCRTVVPQTSAAGPDPKASKTPREAGVTLPSSSEIPVQSAAKVSLPSSEKAPIPSVVEVYVITESVFSMDGDSPDLKAFAEFCRKMNYHLIVDEAHAVGVFGKNGQGLVQELGLEEAVFARIITFGKAMGCHGAGILGSQHLKDYLVNFARSLIYTTGLPPHSVATILASYEYLRASGQNTGEHIGHHPIANLSEKIKIFNRKLEKSALSVFDRLKPSPTETGQSYFIPSTSAIHCCIIPGNERVLTISEKIRSEGLEVKAILSPTVPQGQERVRICLHSFNTTEEIQKLLDILSFYIQKK